MFTGVKSLSDSAYSDGGLLKHPTGAAKKKELKKALPCGKRLHTMWGL
jgi:hypothetical protein